MIMSHTTLAQGVCARHLIHVSCACVFDLSSTLSSHSSFVSPIFYFILLIFHFYLFLFHVDVFTFKFIFNVDQFGVKTPCALPRMRSLALFSTTPLSQTTDLRRLHFEVDVERVVPFLSSTQADAILDVVARAPDCD